MSSSTVTRKGQVTLPKDIREKAHLSSGVKIEWAVTESGEIIGKPRNKSALSIVGLIKKRGKPVSLEEMDKAISDMAADQFNE